MISDRQLLSTREVASFVARGFLRFDGVVPEALNDDFLRDFEAGPANPKAGGTPLLECYAPASPTARALALPRVRGAIESLVGAGSIFDHHFYHVRDGFDTRSQDLHQDSTIDPRLTFDIQLLYFPQAVTREMGGTRFLPGSHLRLVHESSIARYQNVVGQEHVVCEAGTVFIFHHGLWHGAGRNTSGKRRVMFKLRLNPSVLQCKLWDTSDLDARALAHKPLFVPGVHDPNDIQDILCTSERWFEDDTQRLEFINRIRLWRHLLGDPVADAHYWLTRIENEPSLERSLQNGSNERSGDAGENAPLVNASALAP